MDDKEIEKEAIEYHKRAELCIKCGNPLNMYWCMRCESNQELSGECVNCWHGSDVKSKVVLDIEYHNNCN